MTATKHREQGERTPNPAKEDQGDYAGIETPELKAREFSHKKEQGEDFPSMRGHTGEVPQVKMCRNRGTARSSL